MAYMVIFLHPASVAQLDARLTDDQYVVGSTHVGSATFFHRDLIMKYFHDLSLPSAALTLVLLNKLRCHAHI